MKHSNVNRIDPPEFSPERKYNKEEFERRLKQMEDTWKRYIESLPDSERKLFAEKWKESRPSK
ncbi:MAG: hypothetical protein F4X44_00845 [Gammaproteobacteria bacterium]|nr:hypothetical protein [Gammaproteobacteria bacterium]MYD79150.1 hypothetical protein [Gammaproteobacteria bacterium]